MVRININIAFEKKCLMCNYYIVIVVFRKTHLRTLMYIWFNVLACKYISRKIFKSLVDLVIATLNIANKLSTSGQVYLSFQFQIRSKILKIETKS